MKNTYFLILFLFFSALPSFSQQYIWSTAGGRTQRTIPMNSVKTEVMRLFDLNNWVQFSWESTNHYTTRNEYRESRLHSLNSEKSVNNQTLVIVHQQMISWMDNHQNFVSAYVGPMFSMQGGRMVWYDYYTVHFIIGNEVIIMGFSGTPPVQQETVFPTNQNNRRTIEKMIDDILIGFPQITPQQSRTNSSSTSSSVSTSNNPVKSSSSYSTGNSSTSTDFLIGYNFSYGFPIGFKIGLFGVFASLNFNLSGLSEGLHTGGSIPDGLTGRTIDNGLEFTIGYSIKLIKDRLRLPIGIGMSMTDQYQYFYDSSGNKGWYGSGDLQDRDFIAEAGLQFCFIDFLYLSATYRLKGFSSLFGLPSVVSFPKHGFSVGAGFIF